MISNIKKIIPIILCGAAFTTTADEFKGDHHDDNYNHHSYGSPQLYYSPESIRERRTQELIKESNDIAKENLEIERERLQYEKREYGVYSED